MVMCLVDSDVRARIMMMVINIYLKCAASLGFLIVEVLQQLVVDLLN